KAVSARCGFFITGRSGARSCSPSCLPEQAFCRTSRCRGFTGTRSMPTEFHWIRPEWLLALPLVALAALVMARRQLAPGNWQRVVDPALAPYVLSRSPAQSGDGRWWLLLLGGVIAVIALAGPSWNRLEQPVFRSEQAIVIALDLSQSMDAARSEEHTSEL